MAGKKKKKRNNRPSRKARGIKAKAKQPGQKPTGRSPGQSVRLSLCMIAGEGDEGQLGRCITSATGLVDEVVVGYTVNTITFTPPDVAKQLNIRSVAVPWDGDFAAARNRTLQEARGEWVLVLDCDEVIAPADHAEILRLIEARNADAYRFTTRNYTDQQDRVGWTARSGSHPEHEDRTNGWFPSTKVRLWRHTPQIRFEGVVHELVEESLESSGSSIGDCLVPVHHYGYVDGYVDGRRDGGLPKDGSRYLEAGERKVAERPDDLLARYELAIAYRDAARLDEGLRAIEFVIEALQRGTHSAHSDYLQEELVHLVHGDLLDRMQRLDEAVEVYRFVADRFPHSHQAFNNMGSILTRQRKLAAARECYQRGLVLAPDNPVLLDNLARLDRHEAAESPSGGASHSISLCMIAKDAAGDLERCLASVASVVDEIIVIDTGSTDETIAVANRFGARTAEFAWADDFAAARNRSLEMATGEWILWMDVDDYLVPADRDKVARARRLKPDRALYFSLVNEGADRTSFRQIKMFPNHPEIRFQRPVHETVLPAISQLGLATTVTDVEVRHTGYRDPESTRRKHAYYHDLMSAWVTSHPDDYDFHFRLGHTDYSEKRFDQAMARFELILQAGQAAVQPRSVFLHATTFTGRCLLETGRYSDAVSALESAVKLDPESVLARLSLGDALAKSGNYEQALPHLQKALAGEPDPHFPQDASTIRYSAQFFIGQCHEASGRTADAVRAYQAAVTLRPERAEAAAAAANLGGDKPRLSLCMIVRDEDERLAKCLDSVRGLCDEIIVVDTGSSDRTVEVAKQYGATVGFFEWCDNFALARNESLRLATGDWVMWLDADDLLPQEHHQQIRHLLNQGRDKSYFFVLDDRGYESVSCVQLRLFPNLEGVGFEMPIHEQVTPSLARLGVFTVPTEIKVVHTGYTTPEVVKAKKDRYLGIMERWLEEHPGDYMTRSHVALTYHTTGRLEEGAEQYRLIIEESTCKADRNLVVYTTALLFLGRSYLRMRELGKARDYIHRAEEEDDEYVLTKLSLAEVYTELGQSRRAIEYAEWILQREPQLTFFPIDQGELEYSALCLAGRGYQALGEFDKAEASFVKAADGAVVGRRAEALGSLSEVYKAASDRDRALQVLHQAVEIDPSSAKHVFNIGMLHLEATEFDEAASRFRQVLEIKPNYGPAILNLGYIAKQEERFEDAEQLYKQLIEQQPAGIEARANLAHLYLDLERYEQAVESFEKVRKLDPDLLDINLGLLLAQSVVVSNLDLDLAERTMASIGEISVDFRSPASIAESFVEFGALLVREGQLKCAEMALRVTVNLGGADAGSGDIPVVTSIKARRCLGEVYYARGMYWDAVRQHEAILLADPRDGETFKRLGDCYARLGVDEAAKLCYDRAGPSS